MSDTPRDDNGGRPEDTPTSAQGDDAVYPGGDDPTRAMPVVDPTPTDPNQPVPAGGEYVPPPDEDHRDRSAWSNPIFWAVAVLIVAVAAVLIIVALRASDDDAPPATTVSSTTTSSTTTSSSTTTTRPPTSTTTTTASTTTTTAPTTTSSSTTSTSTTTTTSGENGV